MAKSVELSTVQATQQLQAMAASLKALASASKLVDTQLRSLETTAKNFTSTGKQMQMMMRSNAVQQRLTARAAREQKARFRELNKEMQSVTRSTKTVAADFRGIGRQMKIVSASNKNATRDFREIGRQMQIVRRSAAPLAQDFSTLGIQMQRAMRSAEPLQKNFSDVGRQMQVMMRSQKRVTTGMKEGKKASVGFSTAMSDIGSSAVITFGPLSGVGSRIIALASIIKRGNAALIAITLIMTATTASFVGMGIAAFKAGLSMQKILGTLRAATGSMGKARKEFQFISDLANELGFNIESSARQFSKLSAAARGTALEGDAVRDIFEGVSIASTAMRLTTEQTTGALRAIEQMISKGNVQAEELRGQLGERLPGAFQLAADAMGVTTSELDKMLRKGEVLAEDLLPALGKLLKETFAGEAAVASGQFAASLERFKSELFEVFVEIERRIDLLETFADLLNSISSSLEKVNTNSTREEFRLLSAEVDQAEEKLSSLLETPQADIDKMSPIDLKQFNTETLRAFGEFDQATDALLAATQEKMLRFQELQNDIELLSPQQRIEMIELEALLKSIRETGAVPSDAISHLPELRGGNTGLGSVGQPAFNVPSLPSGGAETALKTGEAILALRKRIKDLPVGKELTELRLELESLGKTELHQELAALDVQLEEVTQSINKLRRPSDIPENLFKEKQLELIEEAARLIQGLKDELIQASFAAQALDIGKTIPPDARDKMQQTADNFKEINEEIKQFVERRAQIADMGMTMGQFLATGASAAADEVDKLNGSINALNLKEANEEFTIMAKKQEELEKRVRQFKREIKELGVTLSTFLATGANITADAVDKLGGALDDDRVKEANKQFADQRKELERIAKAADKAAKALEKFKEEALTALGGSAGKKGVAERFSKFDPVGRIGIEGFNAASLESKTARETQLGSAADELRDLERANAVLQKRIAGHGKLADQMEARFELMKKFPELDTKQLQALQKELEGNKELNKVFEEQQRLQEVRRELAEDFASSIGEAFEDAVIEGEKLSDVLQALLDDINRIILRVTVTKPLENLLTGIITGEDPTGSKAGPGGTPFFGGLLGDFFSSFGSSSGGGVVSGGPGTPGARPGGGIPGGGVIATPFEEVLANLGVTSKATTSAIEGVGAASKITASKMEGDLVSGILRTVAAEGTETVTTTTLTASLVSFNAAVIAATASLSAMGAGSAISGGGGALSSILNFGSSFGGNPGLPFGGMPPNFVPGFGFTGPRQHGGPTGPNSPVLVGEDGPEIFRPNRSGRIEPLNGGSSPIIVNQTMNVTSPDEPGFRRTARSNMRVMGRAAKTALRRI